MAGPAIGGIIITFSHWRNIYWLQVGMSALGLIMSFVWVPNIQYEVQQLAEMSDGNDTSIIAAFRRFNPIKILKQLLKPQVLISDVTCGFLGVTQYGILTSVRHIVNPRFGLTTPLVSGLFYLAPGMGFILGSLCGGHLSDMAVKRYIKKRNGLRLPKDRLNSSLIPLAVVLPTSLSLYGWSLDKGFGRLALPIVMAFWIGLGLMSAWNALNTYSAGKCCCCSLNF